MVKFLAYDESGGVLGVFRSVEDAVRIQSVDSVEDESGRVVWTRDIDGGAW